METGTIVRTTSVHFKFGQFLFTEKNPIGDINFKFEFIDIVKQHHIISNSNIDDLGEFIAAIKEYIEMIESVIEDINEIENPDMFDPFVVENNEDYENKKVPL